MAIDPIDHNKTGSKARSRAQDAGDSRSVAVGYELKDINFRPVLVIAISILIGVALIGISQLFFLRGLDWNQQRQLVQPTSMVGTNSGVLPPEPRLQVDVVDDMEKFRAQERKTLESYGWIDKDSGVARIPIKEAINRLAQTGALPARLPAARSTN